jgi:hypothetical protein
MAAVMLWHGDPTATPGFAIALRTLCLALAVLTGWLLATYTRQGPDEKPILRGVAAVVEEHGIS